MTSVFRTESCRGVSLKIGLALALVFSQMFAQAAANLPEGASTQVPDQPDAADKSIAKDEVVLPDAANKEGPVIVSTDKVQTPKKKHEVKRGKVKPDMYPTKPQQVVKALR